MNSTNDKREKELIIKNANEIKNMEEPGDKNSYQESYFISGKELLAYRPEIMMEYSPESPIEMEYLLNNLWEKRNTPEMMTFKKVCVISAMKNRNVIYAKEDATISSVIYEF